MIKLRTGDITEEITLDEFEKRARKGSIPRQAMVCFPPVTGSTYVPADKLEFFRGLHSTASLTFRQHFHLSRVPWLTVALIAALVLVYTVVQDGAPRNNQELIGEGAKSIAPMIELGQWWRIWTANFLHVSWWHLLINCIFLFNLGGPTEAIYRRLDYAIILVASAFGTNALSTIANPAVSCGASGLVFGVWGAAAVFGMRYRDLLPQRYRRYFIGGLIPYAVFSLYLGLAMPGVDNWAHFGGLLGGCIAAAAMPSRILAPRDPSAMRKIVGLAMVAVFFVVLSFIPHGPGKLSYRRYLPQHGAWVGVPARWSLKVREQDKTGELFAFRNEASVALEVRSRVEPTNPTLEQVTQRFIDQDLANQLQSERVRGLKLEDPVDTHVSGIPAKKLRAEILAPTFFALTEFFLVVRNGRSHVFSFSTPPALYDDYVPTFESILNSVRWTEDLAEGAGS